MAEAATAMVGCWHEESHRGSYHSPAILGYTARAIFVPFCTRRDIVGMAVASQPRFLPGSLVKARGRDWVVLPTDEPDVLRLRPLTGSEEDAVGIFLPFEGDRVQVSIYGRNAPRLYGQSAPRNDVAMA
jgi:hypothetical protein